MDTVLSWPFGRRATTFVLVRLSRINRKVQLGQYGESLATSRRDGAPQGGTQLEGVLCCMCLAYKYLGNADPANEWVIVTMLAWGCLVAALSL